MSRETFNKLCSDCRILTEDETKEAIRLMSRDKQIEEMQKLIDLNVFTYKDEENVYGTKGAAEVLYNKGYRKSQNVAREIIDETLEILKEIKDEHRLDEDLKVYCAIRYAMAKIAELKKKYESEGEK